MADRATVAYLAGFFDGEGSIGVYRNGGAGLRTVLTVVNNQSGPIDLFHRTFGGARDTEQAQPRWGRRHVPQRVRLQGLGAGRALAAMLPFLTAKRGQAQLALQFLWNRSGRPRGTPRSAFDIAEDESFAEALRIAKKENL